ncbi:uncharacterized protein LOC105159796 [Sesamum indicum]|uniref:Uncharacterized protein LOC105159796 n=1 Tax=Sesamum indicum TaxID=4182 RepID=A0A6I9SX54_SESIN|nr:uncharacterized protein LOC105159796 [Sesamum indicum]
MKGKGAKLLKQIICMVSSLTRAKCMVLRTKTDAMKARLMVTALTVLSKKKKLSVGAISGKINNAIDGIFNHRRSSSSKDIGEEDADDDQVSKAIVLYSNKVAMEHESAGLVSDEATGCSSGLEQWSRYDEENEDDKYPDLRHSLFDEEEKELEDLLDDTNSSVIDLVKNSKENGEGFNLEDEIDEVADLFINKFHKRIRLQKLLSFKRYQQMLERST